MKSFLEKGINFLFPVNCCCCGGELKLSFNGSLCSGCSGSLEIINSAGCLFCGKPFKEFYGIHNCGEIKTNIDDFYVAGYYSGNIRKVIIEFKYERKKYLGKLLGQLLNDLYLTRINERLDLIMPVPLTGERKRRRGYNQAEVLARELSNFSGIKMKKRILIKTRETETQSLLKKSERLKNIRGVFKAKKKLFGKSILLVDDVATTGATLQSCSGELKKSGAEKVTAVVVAHG